MKLCEYCKNNAARKSNVCDDFCKFDVCDLECENNIDGYCALEMHENYCVNVITNRFDTCETCVCKNCICKEVK